MLPKCYLIFPAMILASSIAAHAQNLRDAAEPAELPPASFGGAQYVDSDGCVFLRAGVNGNTVWVPRVTRARRLVCGRTPTFAAVEPAARVLAAVPVVQAAATPQPAPTTRRVVAAVPVATRAAAPVVLVPRQGGIDVQSGFRSAWNDGRLNPNRGPRTEQGDAQMALVWTNTVPRRLVVKK